MDPSQSESKQIKVIHEKAELWVMHNQIVAGGPSDSPLAQKVYAMNNEEFAAFLQRDRMAFEEREAKFWAGKRSSTTAQAT